MKTVKAGIEHQIAIVEYLIKLASDLEFAHQEFVTFGVKVDQNGDSVMQLEELTIGAHALSQQHDVAISDEEIQMAFQSFDWDESGSLDQVEGMELL